jgi:predicted nucleotidyltransferase
MSRDEVLAKLRQHAPELQAEGILHLALFGSTARDDAGPNQTST